MEADVMQTGVRCTARAHHQDCGTTLSRRVLSSGWLVLSSPRTKIESATKLLYSSS